MAGSYRTRHPSPNKKQAKTRAKSKGKKLGRATRTLDLTIIGNTKIMADIDIRVQGLRPRIDDAWRVKTAVHTIDESGAYTTKITGEKPK